MKLYEYQGKTLFEKYGIRIPKGVVINSVEDVSDKLHDIKMPVMVKAQVLSGGRGKAGGVVSASRPAEIEELTKKMLNSRLSGSNIDALLVEEKVDFAEEYYLSITMDSMSRMPMIIFCTSGGMDIEEIASRNPGKISRTLIDPLMGLQGFHFKNVFKNSGITDKALKEQLKSIIMDLYKIYEDYDAMLVEINPLMHLADNSIIAADAKVELDDSGIFRHADILQWRENMKVNPLEKMARDVRFLYIDVNEDGNVAVISNGSGMIMSCVDRIAREGGRVLCALDLGGGATSERVAEGIKIMLKNNKVETLLISIFGGITRCDEIAGGIVKAVDEMQISVPIVARLEGTNKEKGMALLEAAGSQGILIAQDLEDAALKVMIAQKYNKKS